MSTLTERAVGSKVTRILSKIVLNVSNPSEDNTEHVVFPAEYLNKLNF